MFSGKLGRGFKSRLNLPFFWGEKLAKRTLVIKMKGKLKEINAYCAEVGEISNKYDIDVEFE